MASNTENIRSSYYEKLSGDVKDRYEEKIRKCGGIDPYTIKPKNLSSNSKDFPQITIYDITNYMIHSVSSYTKRFFENYKGTEAYKFFESGFVVNIGSKQINNFAIVMGKVLHSQRLNDSASHVWVLAEMDGQVICAHCTCIAGLSETCSHVGGICFAVNKISESKETKSVTDILCKWNVPKFKEVSMSAAKDMDWRFSTRQTASYETSFLEYCDSIPSLSNERIDRFLNKCTTVGDDTALRSIIFPSEKKRLTNLKDEIFLSSLYDENYREKSHRELVDIGRTDPLNISEDDIREIFKLTLHRLKSKCYLGLRRGRITGSTFKSCCVPVDENPSIVTIKRVISPIKNLRLVPTIKYEAQNKKKAVQQYVRDAVLRHDDFVYSDCGLIINPKLPYFAASPDGLIHCSCHGDGCLEINCLNIPEIDTLDEFLTRKPNNMFNKFGDLYTVERSHDLFYRIQLHINLNCSKYCDCVIWTPQKAIVVKVFADIEFWNVEMSKAMKFHEQIIMPELLSKFFTRKIEEKSITESNEEDIEYELLALEIEILDIKECQYVAPSATLSETIPTFELSKEQRKSQLQQSTVISFSETCPTEQKLKGSLFNSKVEDLKYFSLEEICSTFDLYHEYLSDVYCRLIKETKRNYYPRDLPSFAAFDLVSEKQFTKMIEVAESKLTRIIEQNNSTDVIFDAIIAEWAYKIFCEKYNFNREEAVAAVEKMNSLKLLNQN